MKKTMTIMLCVAELLIFACKKQSTEQNPEPVNLEFQITDVSIHGGSDGAVDLKVTGGSPPYKYEWSTGANTEDINNLAAGNYWVNVTDDANQTQIDSILVQ